MNVKQYGINYEGNDYVVGDIHGCFNLLQDELDRIGFNEEKDRLFFVGDLVDRGPDNTKVLQWLNKLWFKGARGNHEQMAIDFVNGYGMDKFTYAYNGGQWFIDLPATAQRDIAATFQDLPFMIEVKTENHNVGIIHAEVPGGDWAKAWVAVQNIDSKNQYDPHANVALWSRDKINYKDPSFVTGIDHVFVGHTPLKAPVLLGNVNYIDTGAVFAGKGRFTIVNLKTLEQV